MSGADPSQHLWWIASRSLGVVAMVLLTVSVVIGLTMSGRVARRPALRRWLVATHEHTAVGAMVAIAMHGITLLGDPFLKPGVAGVAVPFAGAYKPPWTGLGIVAGYLVAALALSFYFRRRIGVRRWRSLHRFIVVGWALSVVHTLGSGSDSAQLWLRLLVLAPAGLVLTLLAYRIATSRSGRPAPAAAPEGALPGLRAVRADHHDDRGAGGAAATVRVGRLDLGDA